MANLLRAITYTVGWDLSDSATRDLFRALWNKQNTWNEHYDGTSDDSAPTVVDENGDLVMTFGDGSGRWSSSPLRFGDCWPLDDQGNYIFGNNRRGCLGYEWEGDYTADGGSTPPKTNGIGLPCKIFIGFKNSGYNGDGNPVDPGGFTTVPMMQRRNDSQFGDYAGMETANLSAQKIQYTYHQSQLNPGSYGDEYVSGFLPEYGVRYRTTISWDKDLNLIRHYHERVDGGLINGQARIVNEQIVDFNTNTTFDYCELMNFRNDIEPGTYVVKFSGVTFWDDDIINSFSGQVSYVDLTVSKTGNGTVSPEGTTSHALGNTVSVDATPDAGNQIDKVRINGANQSPLPSFPIDIVMTDVMSVEVDFIPITNPNRTLTVQYAGNATADIITSSGEGDVSGIVDGSIYTLVYSINGNRAHFDSIMIDGGANQLPSPVENGQLDILMDADKTVVITANVKTYSVTVNIIGTGSGSVSGFLSEGANTKEHGESGNITMSPNTGSEIELLEINGVGFGTSPIQLIPPIYEDTTVNISFAEIVSPSGDGGIGIYIGSSWPSGLKVYEAFDRLVAGTHGAWITPSGFICMDISPESDALDGDSKLLYGDTVNPDAFIVVGGIAYETEPKVFNIGSGGGDSITVNTYKMPLREIKMPSDNDYIESLIGVYISTAWPESKSREVGGDIEKRRPDFSNTSALTRLYLRFPSVVIPSSTEQESIITASGIVPQSDYERYLLLCSLTGVTAYFDEYFIRQFYGVDRKAFQY